MKYLYLFIVMAFCSFKAIAQNNTVVRKSTIVLKGKSNKKKQVVNYESMSSEKLLELGNYHMNRGLNFRNDSKIDAPKEYKTAFQLYLMAAQRGLAEAQFKVGDCYENYFGVSRDYDKALYWYEMAAKQGHVDAQYFTGKLYYWEKKNRVVGLKWLFLSAEQGNKFAQQYVTYKTTPNNGAYAMKDDDFQGRYVIYNVPLISTGSHKWGLTSMSLSKDYTILHKWCLPEVDKTYVFNSGNEYIEDALTNTKYFIRKSDIGIGMENKTVLFDKKRFMFAEYYPVLPDYVKVINIYNGNQYIVKNLQIR